MRKLEKIRFLKETNEEYFEMIDDLNSNNLYDLYKINAIQNCIIQNYQTIIEELEKNERENIDIKCNEIR